MHTAEDAIKTYQTPFQRHLSFFDRDGDGIIYYGDSLRGNLSLGIDFPVAAVMAFGYHAIYGNSGSVLYGPLRPINVHAVTSQRNQLETIRADTIPTEGMTRQALAEAARPTGLLDRAHVLGLWALAANKQKLISKHDIQAFQQGTMFYELAARRRNNRDHVLPLYRGGPAWVGGHSYVVDKLFGVKVYQLDDSMKSR